ncbi:fimbrial protein [Paraherbaspirillum soli]|uniref:Fimbrial protein n=1 Tax=Paraherbaspirillum soli TaxID=631222 RepID=A0ABW0MDP6_9BURK
MNIRHTSRRSRRRLALLTALLVAASNAPALADSITLNVTGTITATSCTVNAADANQTVAMGSIGAGDFNAVGATSAAKDFYVKLNCPSVTNLKVALKIGADKDADSVNPDLFKLSAGSGAASGVALELLNTDGKTVLKPGTTLNWTPANTAAAATGYKLFARYKQTTAAVTPGTANGSVTVDISYD